MAKVSGNRGTGYCRIGAVALCVAASACSGWIEVGAAGNQAAGGPLPVRSIRLPILMEDGLHTRLQVCSHAREHEPDKRFALVVIKSHICDFEGQGCLKVTRDVSDTCNGFVRSNFALYHARLYRNTPDRRHLMEEIPLAWDIAGEWSNNAPMLIVLDLKTCERAGQVQPLEGEGKVLRTNPSALARFRNLQALLLGLPAVAERIRPSDDNYDARCLSQPEPGLLSVWEAMDQQK